MFFKRKRPAAGEAPSVAPPPAPPPPPARAAVEPDGELDVRALGHALWRRKWSIIIPTIVVTALAAVAVHVITPQYKSSATILYEGRENIFLRPDVDKATAFVNGPRIPYRRRPFLFSINCHRLRHRLR